MLAAGLGPIMFLVIVNVILLIGGQFMEPSGLIVIVAPLVFPIAIQLGIDPIHLGIIMVVNMEIGMITPPVGLNLFVTSGVAGYEHDAGRASAALPFTGSAVRLPDPCYLRSDHLDIPADLLHGAGDHNELMGAALGELQVMLQPASSFSMAAIRSPVLGWLRSHAGVAAPRAPVSFSSFWKSDF